MRLPEWNDLTNEQRRAICDEAELWAFDAYLERDAAVSIYRKIRQLVTAELPPLIAPLHATPPQHQTDKVMERD